MAGHPADAKLVCLHEERWEQLTHDREQTRELLDEIRGVQRDIHNRLFKDNGKLSIQTSLVQGDARMGRIEEQYANLNMVMATMRKQLEEYQHGVGAVAVNEVELEQQIAAILEIQLKRAKKVVGADKGEDSGEAPSWLGKLSWGDFKLTGASALLGTLVISLFAGVAVLVTVNFKVLRNQDILRREFDAAALQRSSNEEHAIVRDVKATARGQQVIAGVENLQP